MFKLDFSNVPRFFVAGALATSVHYTILFGLYNFLDVALVLATSVGALCGAIVNYLINYFYTFDSQRRHVSALSVFFMVAGTGMLINALIVAIVFHSLALPALVAQITATTMTFAWNYQAHQHWTF